VDPRGRVVEVKGEERKREGSGKGKGDERRKRRKKEMCQAMRTAVPRHRDWVLISGRGGERGIQGKEDFKITQGKGGYLQ